jgi:AGCS family alanine or glycine:cation symporter
VTGIIITIFTALVILGGIKSIGRVTAYFVPIMALFYLIAELIVLIMNAGIVQMHLRLFFLMPLLEKLLLVVQLVQSSAGV